MKRTIYILFLVSSLIVLQGCASGIKYADMKDFIPNLNPDLGRIYFYRNSVIGGAIQPNIMLNDEKVGKSVPQGFFFIDKAPGEYKASTKTEVKKSIDFTLEPSKVRYIRFDISFGVLMGHVTPILVEEEQAKKDMLKCKYIGTLDMPTSKK